MSNDYYYLAASLPLIDFDTQAPMSSVEYLELCESLLSKQDFQKLQEALSDFANTKENAEEDVVVQWLDFDRKLKNEMAVARALKSGKEPSEDIRGDRYPEPFAAEIVAEAIKSEDILNAEKLIDKARWQKLDELQLGHHFDLEFVIIYALKLKILNRYQEIRSVKGEEKFEEYKKIEAVTLF